MTASAETEARISAAVRRHLGAPGRVHGLARLTGGATRATWSFDAEVGDHRIPLVLQQTLARAAAAPAPSGAQDAALLRAAARAGVPAPRVRFVLTDEDGLGEGVVCDRVEGETLGRRIVAEPRFAAARERLAAQCGEALARIHRIDRSGLDFLVEQDAAAQLAAYRALADRFDPPHPALEWGLAWAAEHLPRSAASAVVHGDFRNGNLVVDEEGLRCVLDWELAQVCDPMLDLGWLCVKTWRFGGALPVGGFGRRDALFEAYEKAGGGRVDPDHVRFWEAFGCVKWAVMCLLKGRGALPEGRGRLEAAAIGRRVEEPLLDLLDLVTGRA